MTLACGRLSRRPRPRRRPVGVRWAPRLLEGCRRVRCVRSDELMEAEGLACLHDIATVGICSSFAVDVNIPQLQSL